MQFPDIKKIIQPNFALSALLVVLFLISWGVNYYFYPNFELYDASSARLTESKPISTMLIILGLTALNLLLIDRFNYKYNVIRTKTFLPLFIYALLITSWKETHLLPHTHLVLSFFIGSLMLFFSMYKNKKTAEQAFLGSILLSIVGLMNPVYLIFFPLSWIGFIMLQAMSIRTFLASILGAVVPFIFYFSYLILTKEEINLYQHISIDFQQDNLLINRSLHQTIYIIALLIILFVGVSGVYRNHFNDSIQARKYLNFIFVFMIFMLAIVIIFSNNIMSFMPMIAFGYAMLLSHPFSLYKSKFYSILFVIFILLNVVYLLSGIALINL